MKILLISYYYKHKNAMASIRAIKLAKFFSRQGHDVTVLTSNQKDTWTKNYQAPMPSKYITEIYAPEIKRWTNISNFLSKRKEKGLKRVAQSQQKPEAEQPIKPAKKSLKAKIKGFLSWLFYFNVSKQEDVCMFKGLKKEFKRSINDKFDVCIATYPTYGAFLTGIWLKKKKLCDTFIADFRDPLYNPGFRDRKAEANYDIKCLKNTIKHADKIVCVSQGILDGIIDVCPSVKNISTVITNGYDVDDVQTAKTNVNFDKNKINFVYAGALYHGKRTVDMLANTIKELIDDKIIKVSDFNFHYAGSDFDEYQSQLKAYGLEKSAINHGFVSREESIAMQKDAQALLLLTWNESSYKGVIPGKLFEYMSIGVPIIALITGNETGSEVYNLIKQTNSGFAIEQANSNDLKYFKEFLIKLFNREVVNLADTSQFDYNIIAKNYIEFAKEN